MDRRTAMTSSFCRRWLRKAEICDPALLDDAFDKFFTLFVAFNRLYSHIALVQGCGDAGDRESATRLFAEAVGHNLLWQRLTSGGGDDDVRLMRELIEPGGPFFLISTKDPLKPDRQRNLDLHQRLGSDSRRVTVEAVLEYLYKARCNMFHGHKDLSHIQLQFLQPCLRCLERIIRAGLERFDGLGEGRLTLMRPPPVKR